MLLDEEKQQVTDYQHVPEDITEAGIPKEPIRGTIGTDSSSVTENEITLKRTISRKPPNPLCSRCKQGLTSEEGQPCDVHDGFEDDPNIVLWDGDDDPERPLNWPTRRKLAFTIVACAGIAAVSLSASIFGPATHVTAAKFGVGIEVMNLAISLHILGFACGPLLFGPLSEVLGRAIPYWIGLIGLAVFQIPQALAGNVRTILVCRFFEGTLGSAIFAVCSGMMVDVWPPIPRGVALGLSATCINLGSTIAPTIAGFVVQHAGWRWTAWATLIYAGAVGIASLFIIRETFEPVLLARRARRLRFETKNWALHAKSEETPIDVGIMVQRYLTKPIRMFVQEPILMILTAYMTLVYGTLFLSYQALPFSFQKRGWSPAVANLPFIAVTLGILSAFAVYTLFTLTWYNKRWSRTGSATPEDRLPTMILGSLILPPALWWFGWAQHTHWSAQVIAAFFLGLGLLLIFDTGIVYLVDVYVVHANSAMSIHVVVRSTISCSFPLFAGPMYNNLGTAWATTVLGFAALVMVLAPIVFWKYGAQIRSWSRFSFGS
ncbi:hypothetical protein MBLNU459_g2755t1 [Dothideomycetes sp. NU459]